MNQTNKPALENKKILIIFDMDETLIHSTKESLVRNEDFWVEGYRVFKRPFLNPLLINLYPHFSLAIWSSGTEAYVKSIIDKVTPDGITFQFIWSREKCTLRYNPEYNDYFYVKKLEKVEKLGFTINKMLIIEDMPYNVILNHGNAIIVQPFVVYDDKELELLCNYLLTIKDIQNVRTIDKRKWKSNI